MVGLREMVILARVSPCGFERFERYEVMSGEEDVPHFWMQ